MLRWKSCERHIKDDKLRVYQPSGKRSTCSPSATPHRLLNAKWPTGSGNRSTPRLLDPTNKFCKKGFDSIIHSMRTIKIQNGHEGGPKMVDGVWKEVSPFFFGCSCQLSPNKILTRGAVRLEKVVTE